MLTDSQVRDLLAAAADTIDVAPARIESPRPVRRWPLALAAAAAVAALAIGITLLGGRGDSTPTPTGTPTPAPADEHDSGRVDVPFVSWMPLGKAEAILEGAGLGAITYDSCAQPVVINQSPEAGLRVTHGREVQLMLGCRTDPPASNEPSAELERFAQEFIDFASGAADGFPYGYDAIDLHLGGAPVKSFNDYHPTAASRRVWGVCSPEGAYAARECPVSALDTIAWAVERDEPIRIVSHPGNPPCGPVWVVPPAVVSFERVVITGGTNCLDWWAVALYRSGDDHIAVDLMLSEP